MRLTYAWLTKRLFLIIKWVQKRVYGNVREFLPWDFQEMRQVAHFYTTSTEITIEIKKEIGSKLGRQRKAVYNKSSNMKQGASETGIKTIKKIKNNNQIYYQQNKKVILDTLHQYYEDNSYLVKSKSRKYRAKNRDVIQTRKSQHFAQSRHKIREKQHNYCDRNVDFIIEKRRIINKQKKIK